MTIRFFLLTALHDIKKCEITKEVKSCCGAHFHSLRYLPNVANTDTDKLYAFYSSNCSVYGTTVVYCAAADFNRFQTSPSALIAKFNVMLLFTSLPISSSSKCNTRSLHDPCITLLFIKVVNKFLNL